MKLVLKRVSGYLLVLLLWLTVACQKENPPSYGQIEEYKARIEQIIDKGEILAKWVKVENEYSFHFEKETILISAGLLREVESKKEEWKTVLVFSDDSKMIIPSMGEGLDFIVKDLTLNPSGHNPLAAKIEVFLPANGRVKIVVHGKDGQSGTISHLFKEKTARQHLPVLGLYEDYENQVDIVFSDYEGNERGKTRMTITTAPLHLTDFPTFQVNIANKSRMEPGVNLVCYPGESEIDTSRPYMLDENGEIRWILLFKDNPELAHFAQSIGLKRTRKGTYISGDMSEDRILEFDVLGNLLNQWSLKKMGYSFHHEIAEAKNGNFLITVTKDEARLTNGEPRINDHIIEFDPVNGNAINEWDLADMLDTSRYQKPDGVTPEEFRQKPNNWAHNNAVTEMGADIVASMRYQGIMRYSRAGQLKWVISPHSGWSKPYQKFLLTPMDKAGHLITDPEVVDGLKPHPDFEWAWGPHTPVVMSNGNILVFDNGYNRHFASNVSSGNEDYSRAVEYKIDEKKMTVQQVWQYGEERGRQTFAQALSGVQFLEQTGNILFCPGMGTQTHKGFGGYVIEVDPETREVVFELSIAASYTAFHRVTRMTMYPQNL